jgi:hypothetical protein
MGRLNWPSDKGLFFRDTRVISNWSIYANGEPWTLLNGGAITRVLASPRRDRAVAKSPVARPARRRSARSHARRGAAYSGAVARTSSSASSRVCNAVPRPLCSGALAHASGESARGGDARRATPHLCRTRLPPKRATIPTLADGFAPAVVRNARAYRDYMQQLCLELLLPPKREWTRPPPTLTTIRVRQFRHCSGALLVTLCSPTPIFRCILVYTAGSFPKDQVGKNRA